MALSGRALAEAHIKVRADMSAVAGDVAKGTSDAVTRGARSASRRMKDAIVAPVKEGFVEAVKAADPGGQAVGGRFRQGLAARLRGIATDSTKAGQDAGGGIAKGLAGKMPEAAAAATKGGKDAGDRFGKSTGKAVRDQGGYLGKLMKSTAGQVFGGFAAEAAGEKVIEFFAGAVSGASHLSEAGNKLQVMFGSAAPKVQEWAKGAATSMGLSKLAALDAAGTFGIFAKSAGLSGDEAAGFSEKMVGLAGDMASFNDTTPEQAIEAIGSALRGESEPIRAYGVLLDDATLRQEALRLGLVKTTTQALTPQQRVLAAQAAILKQTGAAQGDFARTSGSLANQQRSLSAQFTDAQAALGEKLLPVILRVVNFLNTTAIPAFAGVVDFLGKIPGPVYAVIATIGGVLLFGKAVGAIQAQALAASKGLQVMGLSAARANGVLGALGKGAGLVALAAIANQLEETSGSFTSATVGTKELQGALTQLGTTGTASGAALDVFKQGWGPFSQDVHTTGEAVQTFGLMAKGAIGGASESFLDMVGRWQSGEDRMGRLTKVTQQYDAALAAMATGGSGDAAKKVFDQLAASATGQGVSIEEINKLFPQYTAAVTAGATAATGAAGATDQLTAAEKAAKVATDTQKQAVDLLTGALDANNNAVLRGRAGEAGYEAAVDDVATALKANGRTLDVHSAKGRANIAVVDNLSSTGLAYLETIRKNVGVGPKFRSTLDLQWRKLYDAQIRFGATKGEARRYADQIYKTPKALATKVTAPGMTAAQKAFKNLKKSIDDVPSRTVTLRANADGSVTRILTAGGHTTSTTMKAAGGFIRGPGTGTSDSIPARLSDGEYVVNAAATARHRPLLEAINTQRSAGFAAGGLVERSVTDKVSVKNIPRDIGAVIHAGVANLMAAAYGGGGGGIGAVPKGSGVARWGPMVHRALAALGLAQSLWDNWMRQIGSESAGNPNITQSSGVKDVNYYSGNLAQGLLQVIPPTFRAYHVAGTSWNIHDAWANMMAAMNYGKHRYGSSMEGVIGHGHGYAAGTVNAAPGWAWAGEGGKELIRFRGGEEVKTAAASRHAEAAAAGPVRLHPDTVADLGAVIGAALARTPIVLDGRTVAGYVDRSLGRTSLSVRG